MPFRDDRDALLARIASLEAEAARASQLEERLKALEVENRSLRDENARLNMALEPYRAAEDRQRQAAGEQRRKKLPLIAASCLVLLGVAGFFLFMRIPKQEEAAPAALEPVAPVPEAEPPPPPPPPAPPPPPPAPPTREQIWDGYAGSLCGGMTDCYIQNDAFGNFQFRLDGRVGPDGMVASVDVQGDPPAAVRACLVETLRARRIDGYADGEARVRCEGAGMLTMGTRMISVGHSFTPLSALDGGVPPDADQPLPTLPIHISE